MLPEAPVRFSTRNDLPVFCVNRWATRRVTTSTADGPATGCPRVAALAGHSMPCAKRGLENKRRSVNNRCMTKGYLNLPWGQVNFRSVEAPAHLPVLLLLHH